MADSSLQILVDTEVHVAIKSTPRKVVEALKRQVRPFDAARKGSGANGDPVLPGLLDARDGGLHLPQGMLPCLTEICQRQQIPYRVEDRRAMVTCPRLLPRFELDDTEQRGLRQLLMRDSGVVVAPESRRWALAVELLARRQQRALLATQPDRQVSWWIGHLQQALALTGPQVAPLGQEQEDSRVVVGGYDEVERLPAGPLRDSYGMVVFDSIEQVDAELLLRLARRVGSRYILGLAGRPTRTDGLHEPIFLSLGGVLFRVSADQGVRPPPLSLRKRVTSFAYPYEGRHQYQALLSVLAADPARGQAIAEDLAAEARAGQCCLVLSERRDHLDHLLRALPPDVAASAETLSSAVRVADRSRILERFDTGELRVLLATSQVLRDGGGTWTCRPGRLFLTFPFAHGRRLEHFVSWLLAPSVDQQDAVIYDYDDYNVFPLHRAFEARQRFLARLRRALQEDPLKRQLDLPLP